MTEQPPDRLDPDFESETIAGDEPPDDTGGGPLSGGAGEGSGQDAEDAPDLDVPGEPTRASEQGSGSAGR